MLDFSIDLNLMWFVIFVLAVVLLIYLIIALKNLNDTMKTVRRILQKNEEHLNSIMNDVSSVSNSFAAPIKGLADFINFIIRAATKECEEK